MKAYIFPGQGAQFVGMGKDLYEHFNKARILFDQANGLLGFDITKVMFSGTAEDLKQTKVAQPAIFLHAIITALTTEDFRPAMVAGHSLGEFAALVANGTLNFEDALMLVSQRAQAMQKACEKTPSTMAAIIGLADEEVESICEETVGIVVPANYNCPGQLVISGDKQAVAQACEAMKLAGAKRALPLPVGGAFHSPLMKPAREELAQAISNTTFHRSQCPVYQNVNGLAHSKPDNIRKNLIDQLTNPVKWTQSIRSMIADGASEFIECGPGRILQGLVKKIDRKVNARSC